MLLILRNMNSGGRGGGEKTKIILEMNRCAVCKWKERVRKIKSQTEGKSHFVYANEKGKAEARAFKLATWALSILPLCFTLPLSVYLSTPGPGIPIACGYSMKGRWEEEAGTGCKQQGSRRDC